MSKIYPSGPANVPEGLTRPSGKYNKRAWIALLGLIVFVGLYFLLTAWFGWTAYRLIASSFEPGGDKLMGFATGLPAAFLSIFLLKALFFVKRGQESEDIELTASEEPKLFEFLNRLADEAGAPRPHRVFVSPRVNAAVFYDLSILNFFFPSKKNLEIGLGLVNVLTLGELKAVLAHEFGHFAQKSMAIGNWVYIAHQIAAHIIAQRDILDRFILGLSRFDLRIAWVGWILRLIVWSIRSLMDSAFSLVVVAQRALSREMEFHADLVAVSLTGSDALIHALHKLQAADDAWDRTLKFTGSEASDGRAVPDVFAIQKRLIKKLAVIFNDPDYGQIPPIPEVDVENHRIFKAALAAPPKMWATHPENSAREENAKSKYVSVGIDESSAWAIFQDKEKLCSQVSKQLLNTAELTTITIEEAIANLDKQFNKAYLLKSFRGAYLGRSITRYADNVAALHGDYSALRDIDGELSTLYPEPLSADLEKVRNLYEEKNTLEGIQARALQVSGSVLRHRGKVIKRKDLARIIESLNTEIRAAEKTIQEHDFRCRTVHLALAHRAGKGWEENLSGLLALLHYADHTEANLRDMQGYLSNIVAVITADDRVTKKELKRLLFAANEAHSLLVDVYRGAGQIELGGSISRQLETASWKEALGPFDLVRASEDNINEWMKVIDDWMSGTINVLSTLSTTALEQLLKVESYLAKQHLSHSELPDAPQPPKVPTGYTTLIEGQERKRQTKLGLWDRFYTADGFIPATFRFAVAASIVGAVVYVSYLTGGTTVTIYNGLANTVKVDISGQSAQVPAYRSYKMELPPGKNNLITTTMNSQIVETFKVETSGGFGSYVYNVAQAMPLVEWTQTYGNAQQRPDRLLGAPRWFATAAQVLFEEPPESVKTKGGGATRLVLSALENIEPRDLLDYVEKETEQQTMIRQHAVWDAPDADFLFHWIGLAAEGNDMLSLSKERLTHYQYDMVAMRLMQDYASDEATYNAVCEEHQELAKQKPEHANLQYLSIRCMRDENQKNLAFIQGEKQWPQNAWFHFAAGYTYAEQGAWVDADRALSAAMKYNGALRERLAVDAMRLKRLLGDVAETTQLELARRSRALSLKLRLETGEDLVDTPYRFYSLLNNGDLEAATIAAREMEDGQARSIRLLAASDGASPELVNEALQLAPEQGIDESTVWTSWALAIREGKDPSAYENLVKEHQPNASMILRALKKVQNQGVYPDFEKDLLGVPLEERGYAYTAASLLLGDKAPEIWKDKAKRLLFASERPYFKRRDV